LLNASLKIENLIKERKLNTMMMEIFSADKNMRKDKLFPEI